MDFFDAINLPERKLYILYNEAKRQRILDLITIAKSWNAKAHENEIDEILHIHGHYTDGFYDEQLEKLFMDMKR